MLVLYFGFCPVFFFFTCFKICFTHKIHWSRQFVVSQFSPVLAGSDFHFSNMLKYLQSHLAYGGFGPTAVCPEEGEAFNHQFVQQIERKMRKNLISGMLSAPPFF